MKRSLTRQKQDDTEEFEPKPPFGVVGLGLIGGSIARALRSAFPTGEIVGVDANKETRREALKDPTVQRALDAPAPALSECNVIFLAVPLDVVPRAMEAIAPFVTPNAIVTDVTALKQPVQQWARSLLPKTAFVGGHPLVAGEGEGFTNSRAEFFEGSPVALCVDDTPELEGPLQMIATLWQRFGAEPFQVSCQEHDELVAEAAHLPYAAAVAHVNLVADNRDLAEMVGPNFVQATARAGLPPAIHAEVLARNPSAPAALRLLSDKLAELAVILEESPDRFKQRVEEAYQFYLTLRARFPDE